MTLVADLPKQAALPRGPTSGAGLTGAGGRLKGLLPLALPLAIVVLWQGASSLGLIGSRLMPAPLDVVEAFWLKLSNGELAVNVVASGARALSGLVVGGSIGFLLGLANGLSKLSYQMTDTTLQMLRTIPNLALIPLVILWFGIGEEAKLFLTALGVFFPIYLNTLHGVRNVDPQLIEMGRVYGMSPWTLFRRVIFPGALPSIFVGLRFSLGIMWLTLIVAESMAASSGIGHMANQAREFMLTDVVVLALLIYALLGKGADLLAKTLESLTLQWHPAYQRAEGGKK
jgi:sulfonate transport system permease protein